MLNFLSKLIGLISTLFSWWTGRKPARDRNAIRKAVAEHDAKALNAIIQSRKDKACDSD